MSATFFRSALAGAAPCFAPGQSGAGAFGALRRALRGHRISADAAMDANETYGALEAGCMLAAALFGMILLLEACGLRF